MTLNRSGGPVVLAAAMLVAVLGVATVPMPARAVGVGTLCRAACEARNVRTSCAWLAPKPRRCLHRAVQACRRGVREGLPVACPLPEDLPACLSNHSCPFGALCVDATCQVVACGREDLPPCGGSSTCRGDKCVVERCFGATENCPAGFHCRPDEGPLGSVSGTCTADDPGTTYCTGDVDCIAPGEFRRVCRRGVCERRSGPGRRRAPTTTTTSSTTTTIGATTTTTTPAGSACADVFDCGGGEACCAGTCVADPYAGMGICSTLYTPACTLCGNDDDCTCNGIFCDACEGTASLSGCVDPCP